MTSSSSLYPVQRSRRAACSRVRGSEIGAEPVFSGGPDPEERCHYNGTAEGSLLAGRCSDRGAGKTPDSEQKREREDDKGTVGDLVVNHPDPPYKISKASPWAGDRSRRDPHRPAVDLAIQLNLYSSGEPFRSEKNVQHYQNLRSSPTGGNHRLPDWVIWLNCRLPIAAVTVCLGRLPELDDVVVSRWLGSGLRRPFPL